MTDALPNFEEGALEDVWRFYEEHASSRRFHAARCEHGKYEILKRMREAGADILPTEWGDVELTESNEYAFDNAAVEGDFLDLVERAGIQEEWRRNVSHEYHLKQAWLKKLRKRGPEWRAAIDKMMIASKGTPSITGPSLQEMGGYAPEEEDEEVEAPTI